MWRLVNLQRLQYLVWKCSLHARIFLITPKLPDSPDRNFYYSEIKVPKRLAPLPKGLRLSKLWRPNWRLPLKPLEHHCTKGSGKAPIETEGTRLVTTIPRFSTPAKWNNFQSGWQRTLTSGGKNLHLRVAQLRSPLKHLDIIGWDALGVSWRPTIGPHDAGRHQPLGQLRVEL